MVCAVNQAVYLLKRQIESLGRRFLKEGDLPRIYTGKGGGAEEIGLSTGQTSQTRRTSDKSDGSDGSDQSDKPDKTAGKAEQALPAVFSIIRPRR